MGENGKRLGAANYVRRVNSFFAGIGGFDLAFEKHGFELGFHCEKDDFCRSVLKRNWPAVPSAGGLKLEPTYIHFCEQRCDDGQMTRHFARAGVVRNRIRIHAYQLSKCSDT